MRRVLAILALTAGGAGCGAFGLGEELPIGGGGGDGVGGGLVGLPVPTTTDVVRPRAGAVYDPAVAADDAGAFMITWTEHHAHEGDATPQPDIVYRALTDGELERTSHAAASYPGAQLRSHPVAYPTGFGVMFEDDALQPGLHVLRGWTLQGQPATDATIPWVLDIGVTPQTDATRVAVLGDRGLVLFRAGEDRHWHGALLDTSNGAVLADTVLFDGPTRDAVSVTAGDDGFLVLRAVHDGSSDALHTEVSALMLDAQGQVRLDLGAVGSRYPADPFGPIHAGFHDGAFYFPYLDFDEVSVERPCCERCAVEQPPFCEIEDFRIEVATLDVAGNLMSRGCLDCRVDAGIAIPAVATGHDGVYFHWDHYIARVSDGPLPSPGAWLRPEPEVEHVVFTDWAIAAGTIALVGRGGDLGQQALVVATLGTELPPP